MDERTRMAVAPSRGLALVVAGLLLFNVFNAFVQRIADGRQSDELAGRTASETFLVADPPGWARATNLLGTLCGVLLVILFLVWFSRALKAAVAHGALPGASVGWRVTAWLVPVLNLFTCWSSVAAIWRAGQRDDDRKGLLTAWWIAGSAAVCTAVLSAVIAFAAIIGRAGEVLDARSQGQDAEAVARLVDVGQRRLGLAAGQLSAVLVGAAAIAAAGFVVAATDRLGRGSAFADRASRWSTMFALAVAGTVSLFACAAGAAIGASV